MRRFEVSRKQFVLGVLASGCAAAWPQTAAPVSATSAGISAHPAGTIRLIIGCPPGGSADFTARLIADEMGKELGQSVVVDNRPGAGTLIASDAVAKAKPDGQTLLLNWHQTIVKSLTDKMPYDPDHAFAAVGRIATGGNVLVVNGSIRAKGLHELVAELKAAPGKINAATGGYGSSPHMALAAFELATGTKFNTVHYRGGGPAVQSIVAGDTQVLFASWPSVASFVKAGRLRPLVATLPHGLAGVPEVPGSKAAGLPDYESSFWFGLFAPVGTAAPHLARLHQALNAALAKAEVRAKIAGGGMEVTPSASPQTFAAEVAAESAQLAKVMQALGKRVD
jgi:tripartite-type tricarboxylate transporter receptor subunit TctC